MRTLVIAPTWLCAASAVAAMDEGLFESERAVLLVANNSSPPEVNPSLLDQPEFSSIAERFDRVAYLNDLIYPFHPRALKPKGARTSRLAETIREELGLDEEFLIVAQSIHTAPTGTILSIFPEAPIIALSDGLMSYGPTRFNIKPEIASRLRGLIYLELVPGVEPMLLSEFGIPKWTVPVAAFREVVKRYSEASVNAPSPQFDALLLGQYLAALKLLSPEEEEALHLDMLHVALAKGASNVLFKPHPSAPPAITTRMHSLADRLGLRLEVFEGALPVEVLLHRSRPKLVIGCFSTGLAMASSFYDTDVVSVGTNFVASRLPLLQDSNRIPLLLVHGAFERASVEPSKEPPAVEFSSPTRTVLARIALELTHAMQPRPHTARLVAESPSVREDYPEYGVFFEGETQTPRNALGAQQVLTKVRRLSAVRSIVRFGNRGRKFAQRWYEALTFRP